MFVHGVISLTSAEVYRHHHRKTPHHKRHTSNNSKVKAKSTFVQGAQRDEMLDPVNTLNLEQAGNISVNGQPNLSENQVLPLNGEVIDSQALKLLLKKLLARLESHNNNTSSSGSTSQTFSSSTSQTQSQGTKGKGGQRRIRTLKRRHCNLHGLWLSTVAGAAVELIPIQRYGHIEIQTKIFELPDNPFPSVINNRWTGKGMISPESPTTITVIFQEHIDAEAENHAKERVRGDESSTFVQLPRTAVFVGQCLICKGNPMLQGSWIIFPVTQSCNAGIPLTPIAKEELGNAHLERLKEPNIPDSMYLLRY
ncbi:unnamed protein product [Orchesella dallaii]|uniref:Uncharacterized protein n=1 Tax=Orchesella dallaii TaxID=48710 RepID=A0ABP1QGQ4_9HEXA